MRKKILLSILTLAFVAIAVGTTTFAWFTLSNTATVSNIEGTVQAGEGLEVAYSMPGKTAGEYRNNLTTADWNIIKGQLDEFTFGAVSTKDATNFAHLVQGELDETNRRLDMKNLVDGKNKAKGYLEFQIHFKSDTPGKIMWTGYNFNDLKASNGARIAISTTDNDTYENGYVVVQKPAVDDVNTVTNGVALPGAQFDNITNKGNVIYWDTTSTGNTYNESDLTKITTENIGSVKLATALTTLDAGVQIAEIGVSGVTSVTVRVWLEGWDSETHDDLWRENLNFNLTFEKVPLTP